MKIRRFMRRGNIVAEDFVQIVFEDLSREKGCTLGMQKKVLTIWPSFF
jgi:hypothetical protein